jgi:hypothetical protein
VIVLIDGKELPIGNNSFVTDFGCSPSDDGGKLYVILTGRELYS